MRADRQFWSAHVRGSSFIAGNARRWASQLRGGPLTARPPASSPEVAARMSRARRRDTAPEVAIRREAHRRGLRYRVDAALPGLPRRRADMVFTRRRVAVFVDGCFWHSCPIHATTPTANRGWWVAKLE